MSPSGCSAPSLLFTLLGLNDPEDEGRMLLQTVRNYFLVNMTGRSGRLEYWGIYIGIFKILYTYFYQKNLNGIMYEVNNWFRFIDSTCILSKVWGILCMYAKRVVLCISCILKIGDCFLLL